MIEWLRRNWPRTSQALLTIILVVLSVFALSQSFHEAHWVRNDVPVLAGFWLGLILGWGLALTRWRSWFAALYSLLFSIAAACQMLGGVVQVRQILNAPGFWQAVDLLNLRWLAFYYRANGWFQAAFQGRRVEDTGFFVFLMTLLAFFISVWLLWWIKRKQTSLPGILIPGLLLAVNIQLSKQGALFLLLFLFSAVLLLARTTLLDRYTDWDKRTVDYPYDLGVTWGGLALGMALVIGLVAWLAGLIGTPQTWQDMTDWFRSAREETSETVERLFPNIRPPADDLNIVAAETPNLSEIGAPLPQGNSIIMSVSLSDPFPQPDGVPGVFQPPVHYWRNQIFGTYTGRGWEPVAVVGPGAVAQAEDPPKRRSELQQHFKIAAVHTDALYAASQPVQVGDGVELASAGKDGSTLVRGLEDEYEVSSWVPQVTAAELRAAGTNYPRVITDTFLQLPETLPKRVSDLAMRIAGKNETPYDQALRIQAYLRENYTYDLTIGLAPPGGDVVDDFLFRTQAGFCSHFASAMVVMLRTQGIPARVVGGYAMGTFDFRQGQYNVPESASHAWVEVYFPDYGWIEFEPTAGVGTIVYADEPMPTTIGTLYPNVPETPGLTGRWWFWLAAGAGLTGLIFALLIRFRILDIHNCGAISAPTVFYIQVRRTLAWLGLRARPSTTPHEFLALNADALQELPRLQTALHAATLLHEQAVYSQQTPTREALSSAQHAWKEAMQERLRLAQRRVSAALKRNR